MKRPFLTSLLTLLVSATAIAQPACSVRQYGVRDGLASNLISSIVQGEEGMLWISTWNGLCCYDGSRFTTLKGGKLGTPDAFPTNRLSMIRIDSRHNVWLRTYDGPLFVYDTHQCQFTNISYLLSLKYGDVFKPRNIYPLKNGHTWVTDENHALNLRIDDRYPTDVERMEVFGNKGKTLAGNFIRKVETDSAGQEWILTDVGMVRYGTNEKRQGEGNPPEYSMLKDRKGRTWKAEGNVRLWMEDRFGTIWQLTKDHRLGYYDENTQTIVHSQQLPPVDKILVDQQRNLWFSTHRGLSVVNFRYHRIWQLPIQGAVGVRSVLCRPDGMVWAGTTDGCIAVYHPDGTQAGWLATNGRISPVRTTFSDHIYSLCEDREKTIWIGTKGQGVFTVSPEGTVRHYMPSATERYALSHKDVYDIREDEQGNIWIATFGGGLNLVRKGDNGVLRFIHRDNDLKGYPKEGFDKARRITGDGKGHLLLATTSGLLTFATPVGSAAVRPEVLKFYISKHEQDDPASLRADDVIQALVTRNGDIWVITMGGGLQKLLSKKLLQPALKFSAESNVNNTAGIMLSITEDDKGDIWVVRETSIDRYRPQTNELTQFGPNSLAGYVEMEDARPAQDSNGRLWMGSMNGVIAFMPQEMPQSSYKPNICFTSVQYQGERETHPILKKQKLVVATNRRNLTINFSALDYEDNSLMRYAYKIADKDEEWNYIGHEANISFSQLPPGDHTLIVKSTNSDGVWVDNETELLLSVTPTLTERLWFQLLALFVVIGLSTWALLAWLQYRKENREREQRLENVLHKYQELQVQMEARGEQQESKEYRLAEPEIVNEDDLMMEQLLKFIESRISDEQLKIEEMAEAVNLGRTVFYSKMKELVGVSPSDFLKQVRMQRAEQLIAKSKMTFSEIAFSVGFTDPKYFTKCFKKQTGMTPSEYRQEKSAAS